MSALSVCRPLRGAKRFSLPAAVPKVIAPTASPMLSATKASSIRASSDWSKWVAPMPD